MQEVNIVFKVGLALLKCCHDELVKLPFEKQCMLCVTSQSMPWIQIHYYQWLTHSRSTLPFPISPPNACHNIYHSWLICFTKEMHAMLVFACLFCLQSYVWWLSTV